jgi:Y-X(10)_GDL-associated radical SAM protein
MRQYARELSSEDFQRFVPVHVVWEITLACDLKCLHCGSRAGRRRPRELTTEECFEVIDQLARLGTREISLIGGEAYLRGDWVNLIRRIRSHDIYCAVQTGARRLTPARLSAAVDAGLQGLGVSLDGLAPLHDMLRGVPDSFDAALSTLKRARAAGLMTSVNTQIGAGTMMDLPALLDIILEAGARHWQVQITVAMGNAADHPELLLQPYRVLELMPLLSELKRKAASRELLLQVGNNIGYFGPYEHRWRGFGDRDVHWTGCGAGQTVLALESDGTVKGCPSLATSHFAGGNVRDLTLEQIWRMSPELHFARVRSADDLWGFCRGCYYADVCRGGCTWTTHSLVGRPGNNPYCHYRARTLEKQGLRERLEKRKDAPPESFAVGEYEIITETFDGAVVASSSDAETRPVAWYPAKRASVSDEGRVPPRLELCRTCEEYIWPHEVVCPHCGADVQQAAAAYLQQTQRRSALVSDTRDLLRRTERELHALGLSDRAT